MRIIITTLVAGVIALGGGAAFAQTAPTATSQGSTPPAATTTAPSKATRASAKHASTVHGSFATEADAKSHCPSDTVVWGNSSSKVLHFSGNSAYGKTKHGGYMCEGEAVKAGYHVAKGEKHS